MSDSAALPKTCPQCGTDLPSDATEGLCPRCLMTEAMQPADTSPDEVAAFASTTPLSNPSASRTRPASPELPLPEELDTLLPPGSYHVEIFLGQGGMGAVYKGTQIRLKRAVAIKIMRRDVGRDRDFERRFEHEAQAMARLNHPNIVSVIDFGEAGPDYLYIVMEFVDGADLMDVIRTKRMTQEMALTLLPQICDALQFAHDHGIVHRDIKPSNIMLTRDGHIKMADFGLAKRFDAESQFRTQTGTGMGTPDYAAPEQFIEHASVDHRADIYALGVMIYQMITGTLPRGVWKPPSHRAEVDPQWDEIVSHAMQSDPADRYQHASEIKSDVSQITPRPQEGTAEGSTGMRLAPSKPFRTASTGNAAAKAATAEQSVRAPVAPAPPRKSRAPLFFGLSIGFLLLMVGVFFAIKKPEVTPARVASSSPPLSVSPSPNLPISESPDHPVSPTLPVPPTPAAAIKAAAPAVTAFGPWQPLFTDAEWKESKPGNRETVDGRLHFIQGFQAAKPMPAADGAIRARVEWRKESKYLAVKARKIKAGEYKLQLNKDHVSLDYFPPGNSGIELNKYLLPKPLQPGDTALIELRLQGDHLTGLLNGTVVVEAQDAHLPALGEWGIIGQDGWFESVEVQTTLPTAATSAPSIPSTVTKDAPFVNTLGMKFVPVPGTKALFSIWDTRVMDYEKHVQALEAAGKKTDGSWQMQQKDGVPVGREPDHPVVGVSWEDAQAFCQWLTEKETAEGKLPKGQRYRLPTDEEWSTAAGLPTEQGATPEEKNGKNDGDFPWGKEWPPTKKVGNYADETFHAKFPLKKSEKDGKMENVQWIKDYTDGYATTSPVGSFPANAHGLYDMSGNVWQWCEDWYNGKRTERVQRGAAWYNFSEEPLRTSRRGRNAPDDRYPGGGFRCVLVPAPATVSPSPRLPASASSPSPSAPWQPFFTDAEWKATKPGQREVVDGRLHFTNFQELKPAPAADGAIRARIQYQAGSNGMALFARGMENAGIYKAHLSQDHISLLHFPAHSSTTHAELGKYTLPKPLKPGDTALLELRLQGDHLTVLLDGVAVIEAQDSHLLAPGKWGIIASDGWFESVEVQTPALVGEHWKNLLADSSLVLGPGVKLNGQILELPDNNAALTRKDTFDGAVRMHAIFSNKPEGALSVRVHDSERYSARVQDAHTVRLYLSHGPSNRDLQMIPLSQPLVEGREYQLELRIVGSLLSVAMDGVQIASLHDSTVSGPGRFGVGTYGRGATAIQSLEFLDLDPPTAVTKDPAKKVQSPLPAAAPPAIPFGPWQPLITDAQKQHPKPGVYEVVDGGIHLLITSLLKPQPAADGAIRARIKRETASGTGLGLEVRSTDVGRYKLKVLNGRTLELRYVEGKSIWDEPGNPSVGKVDLSKLLEIGDTLMLELRMQGDRLIALVDGAVAIDTHDSHLSGPGEWGIIGKDGWFESVEVQSPPPAATKTSPAAPASKPDQSPVTSAATATKDTPFVNSLGMKFVPVPGTEVLFCIHETRTKDFAAYIKDGGTISGRPADWALGLAKTLPNNPIAGMTWDDAHAFCLWLSTKEGKTYRLPTDREWSYAVGIADQEKWDANTTPATMNKKIQDQFPWGTQWPPPQGAGNYRDETFNAKDPKADGKYIEGYNDGFSALAPVMSFTPNRLGIYDLGGNVAQWMEDWFDAKQQMRVLRGSAFSQGDRADLLSSARFGAKITLGSPGISGHGFRVVVVPSPGSSSSPPAAAPGHATLTPGTPTTPPASATKEAPTEPTP